jgi:preprotein translocase subunit SecD
MNAMKLVSACGIVAVFIFAGGVGLAQQPVTPSQTAAVSPILNTSRSGFFEVVEANNSGKTLILADPDNLTQRLAIRRVATVSANDVETAQVDFNQLGMPMIAIKLTALGRSKLADFTTQNVGKRLAIVVNDRVLSAPRVVEPITGGQVEVSGNFTFMEAQSLALAIKSGR